MSETMEPLKVGDFVYSARVWNFGTRELDISKAAVKSIGPKKVTLDGYVGSASRYGYDAPILTHRTEHAAVEAARQHYVRRIEQLQHEIESVRASVRVCEAWLQNQDQAVNS